MENEHHLPQTGDPTVWTNTAKTGGLVPAEGDQHVGHGRPSPTDMRLGLDAVCAHKDWGGRASCSRGGSVSSNVRPHKSEMGSGVLPCLGDGCTEPQ